MRLPLLDAGGSTIGQARRHRHHPRRGRIAAAGARLRRHQPAPEDLRQRRTPWRAGQRRRPPAQLGRRPEAVQAAPRRDPHRPRPHRFAHRRRDGQRHRPAPARRRAHDVVGAGQGAPGAAHGTASPAELPPRRLRRRTRPVRRASPERRWPPRPPACATCTRATWPRSSARCPSASAASSPRRWTTSGSPTCSRNCPRPSSCGSSTGWTSDRLISVLDEMEYDDLADLLAEMPGEQRDRILEAMDPDDAGVMRRLLSYEDGTAGALLTPEIIILGPTSERGRRPRRGARSRLAREHRRPGVRRASAVQTADGHVPRRRALPATAARAAAPAARSSAWSTSRRSHPTSPSATSPNGWPATTCSPSASPTTSDRLLGAITVDDVLDRTLPTGWRQRRRVAAFTGSAPRGADRRRAVVKRHEDLTTPRRRTRFGFRLRP